MAAEVTFYSSHHLVRAERAFGAIGTRTTVVAADAVELKGCYRALRCECDPACAERVCIQNRILVKNVREVAFPGSTGGGLRHSG